MLSPSVRNYRFVLGALTIFAIVIFLISSPSQVSDSIEKAKSTFDFTPSNLNTFQSSGQELNDNAPQVGTSPQYADDSPGSQGMSSSNQKDKQKDQAVTSPQFADDTVKDLKNSESTQDPKAVDNETPIKEAPKPQGAGSSGPGLGSGKGFEAIKEPNKLYGGVPEKDAHASEDDDDNDPLANAIKGKTSGASGTGSGSKSSGSSSSKQVSAANCKKDPEYVVMIDAGSTGSRVHVYEFDTCYSPPKLNNEVFKMLKPGLSSFDTDTDGAAKSLDPLMKEAMTTIPEKQRSCSPVAVKATAGLRMLGEEKSKNILAAVREHLEKNYPFPVVEGDGVSIMNGDDEGAYAWITVNYLLGNIGSSEKIPTAAVFDLGGGSTQIVFEPSFKNGEKMVEGQHKREINFGDRDFELYQFSHLGYGLMAGRNKVNGLLVSNAIRSGKLSKGGSTAKVTIDSPCVPPGSTAKDVEVKLENGDVYTVDFKGVETTSGASVGFQCRALAEAILKKDADCKTAPCSFNGVHQPSLVRTFKESSDLYVFSFFYDRTNPLGMPSSFTLQELSDLARIVCNGETAWTSALSSIDGSVEKLQEEPQWCLDLSFQVALLHTGYDIPLQRELKTAKKIANNELGWCLGASLPLLDGKGWKCRIQNVTGGKATDKTTEKTMEKSTEKLVDKPTSKTSDKPLSGVDASESFNDKSTELLSEKNKEKIVDLTEKLVT